MKPLWQGIGILALASLVGCAGITQSGSWRDSQFKGPVFRNVLVVTGADGQTNRRVMEDALADALRQAGIKAQVSYSSVANVAPDDASRVVALPQVQAAIRSSAADAVVTVRVLRVDQRTYDAGPSVGVGVGGGSGGHGGWGGGGIGISFPFFGTGNGTADKVTYEAAVSSVGLRKVVWSASYTMNDSGDGGTAAKELSNQIVTDMRQNGLI